MFWENMFKPCAVKDKGDHDHGDMMTVYDSYITQEQPCPMYTVTPPRSQLMKQSVSSDSEPLTSTAVIVFPVSLHKRGVHLFRIIPSRNNLSFILSLWIKLIFGAK